MANNSAGARSVIYGKTIDHVIEQQVVLSDGSLAHFRPLDAGELEAMCAQQTLEGQCYREVRQIVGTCAEEIERRYPKVLRRVGGYNLDAFVGPTAPFNMAKLHGRLRRHARRGRRSEARAGAAAEVQGGAGDSVRRPARGAGRDAGHSRAWAVGDRGHGSLHPGPYPPEPGARTDCAARSSRGIRRRCCASRCIRRRPTICRGASTRSSAIWPARGFGYRYHRALDLPAQSAIWSVREAALGLSMAMKGDAKSLSFVEDTAVAPERLRDYIERFLEMVRSHGTSAGVYAHASVGCLHVRPVVNLKTEAGVRQFEAIASASADLVLEYGGALSGEHGDGLVRSPFMAKMFGPVLYDAFRQIKRTFDPDGIFNPGKIVDAPPLTANLRYGPAYRTQQPVTFFDFEEYGGLPGAVEMCSGLGACRKTLDGTMCPSYMATREETHSPRGRANVLRLVMAGRIHEAGLGDEGVRAVLDLCLECRACKAECPVGVDVARFKSEFLADYWRRHGTSPRAHLLGHIHRPVGLGQPVRAGVERRVAERAGAVVERAAVRHRLPAHSARLGVEHVRASIRRRARSRTRAAGSVARALRRNLQRHVHELLCAGDRHGRTGAARGRGIRRPAGAARPVAAGR